MKELGEKIVSYWGNRAEGYSEYNREELAGDKWQDWIAEIKKTIIKKRKIENPDSGYRNRSRFFCYLAGTGRISGDGDRLYR